MNDESKKTTSAEANAKMSKRTLGRIAYETFSAHPSYDGRTSSPWIGLPDQVRDAWEATARAVSAVVAPPKSAEDVPEPPKEAA